MHHLHDGEAHDSWRAEGPDEDELPFADERVPDGDDDEPDEENDE